MAEPTANILDIFLKIWVVMGPLLATAVTAVWSRHTQTGDRKFEFERAKEHEARERDKSSQEHERQIRLQKYNEVKAAIADFMASSHEYVRKQSECLSNYLIPERYQAATAANDKFTYSCQVVILLGSNDVASEAIKLSNATVQIPKAYNDPVTPAYERKLEEYRSARAAFTDAARKYLSELETITPSTVLKSDAQI
jgi:hypothetical protein